MKLVKTKKAITFFLVAVTCIFLISYAMDTSAFATPDPDAPQETPEIGAEPGEQEEPQAPPQEGDTETETEPEGGSQTQQPSTGGENTTGSGSTNAGGSQGSSGASSGQSSTSTSSGSSATSGQSGNSATQSQRSTDTRLRTLTISCGQLIPEFDPDIYEYTVYVSRDAEDKSCGTMAESISRNVDIRAEGPLEYENESVRKKVIVSADDGSKSEYIIDVHVVAEYELLMGTTLYSPASQIDIADFPAGFSVVDVDFSGSTFPCATSPDGVLRLVCLNANDEEGAGPIWYTLNPDNSLDSPAELTTVDGEKMIVVSYDGQLAYDENGFLIVTEDGSNFLPLYAQENVSEDSLKPEGRILTIILALITGILAVTCVLLARKKKAASRQPAQNNARYFMPYLKLDEEDEEETTSQYNVK